MTQTIRQLRELRSMDTSNHTLRWNRSMQDAGMVGGIDDDAPTGAAVAWGLGCAFVFGAILLAWWLA
jgi:hypothetical protein